MRTSKGNILAEQAGLRIVRDGPTSISLFIYGASGKYRKILQKILPDAVNLKQEAFKWLETIMYKGEL